MSFFLALKIIAQLSQKTRSWFWLTALQQNCNPRKSGFLAGGAGSKQIFKLLFWNILGSNIKLTKFWSCLHAKILGASDQVISQWSWVETSEQIDNEVNKGQVRK